MTENQPTPTPADKAAEMVAASKPDAVREATPKPVMLYEMLFHIDPQLRWTLEDDRQFTLGDLLAALSAPASPASPAPVANLDGLREGMKTTGMQVAALTMARAALVNMRLPNTHGEVVLLPPEVRAINTIMNLLPVAIEDLESIALAAAPDGKKKEMGNA